MVKLLLLVAGVVALASVASLASVRAEEPPAGAHLRHVVVFQFKDSASEEDVQKVVDAFRALPEKIDSIKGFEFGVNNSPEMLNQGFTHCFLVTFADEAGRDAYLPHPAHKEFVSILRPHLEKAFVIDYWAHE